MPILFQTPLTPSPAATTVDGPVTLSVDLLVTSGDVQQLDVDYVILDPSSAVHFQNGGKMEQLRVPVTAAQMTLAHPTRLRCGSGQQLNRTAQILMTVSSNGVLQAQPIACSVGITSFTCAPDVVPATGIPVLSHALAFAAPPAAPSKARKASGGRRGAAKKKGESAPKRGGEK